MGWNRLFHPQLKRRLSFVYRPRLIFLWALGRWSYPARRSSSTTMTLRLAGQPRQKVGGPVLTTVGRTPRRTTRRMNRLKGTVADLLQPRYSDPRLFGALRSPMQWH